MSTIVDKMHDRQSRLLLITVIAEYKDWLGAPAPCPSHTGQQWADPVADTAEASAL
jgi:hypothetical protein